MGGGPAVSMESETRRFLSGVLPNWRRYRNCCGPTKGDDIVPIPGTTRRKHLEENVAALEAELSTTDIASLEEVMPPDIDQCFRLLEGDTPGFQSRDRHPPAPAELQIVLEMEKPIRSGQTEDSSSRNRSDQTDGKPAPLWGGPRIHGEFLSSGLISQKPQYNDTRPGDSTEQHGNASKPS